MKNLLACLAWLAAINVSAQVVYPYNPDANGDSAVTSGDLLSFLPVFGTSFTPAEITIDNQPLSDIILALQTEIAALNAKIDSLEVASLTSDCVADIAVGVAWRGELTGANLAGTNLDDANFSGANLSSANFEGSSLWYANLSSANLSSANFQGSTPVFADLSNSNLAEANFNQAFLPHANLELALLTNAILTDATLSYSDFQGASLNGANLSGSDLSFANLSGVNLSNTTLSCLIGCPYSLPSGYTCESDTECIEPDRYRIVPE